MRSSLVFALLTVAACTTEGPAGPKGDTGAPGSPGPRGDAVYVSAAGGSVVVDGGVLVVAGPVGPTGAQGPMGGGLYARRTDAYCVEAGTTSLSGMGAHVTCRSPTDLVITGGCDFDEAHHAFLRGVANVTNAPQSTGPTSLEGWSCVWQFMPGVTPVDFADAGYVARVCCVPAP